MGGGKLLALHSAFGLCKSNCLAYGVKQDIGLNELFDPTKAGEERVISSACIILLANTVGKWVRMEERPLQKGGGENGVDMVGAGWCSEKG